MWAAVICQSDKNMVVSGRVMGCKCASEVMALRHWCGIAGGRDLGL